MRDDEIQLAGKLYGEGLTLAEVRKALIFQGYPPRSVNTLGRKLPLAGFLMRRPGRAKKATI